MSESEEEILLYHAHDGKVAFQIHLERAAKINPRLLSELFVQADTVRVSSPEELQVSFIKGETFRLKKSASGLEIRRDAAGLPAMLPEIGRKAIIRQAAFSPNGLWVAVLCERRDFPVQIWELDTGRPQTPALTTDVRMKSASFSADSAELTGLCEDGTIRRIPVGPVPDPTSEWVALLGQVATGRKLTTTGTALLTEVEYLSLRKELGKALVKDTSVWADRIGSLLDLK